MKEEILRSITCSFKLIPTLIVWLWWGDFRVLDRIKKETEPRSSVLWYEAHGKGHPLQLLPTCRSFFISICTRSRCLLSLSLSERGSGGHLDLTELIGVPLPPSVSFTPGYEGFPAYIFGPEANIGRLTKTFVPGSFYKDFAIIVTVTLLRFELSNLLNLMLWLRLHHGFEYSRLETQQWCLAIIRSQEFIVM